MSPKGKAPALAHPLTKPATPSLRGLLRADPNLTPACLIWLRTAVSLQGLCPHGSAPHGKQRRESRVQLRRDQGPRAAAGLCTQQDQQLRNGQDPGAG